MDPIQRLPYPILLLKLELIGLKIGMLYAISMVMTSGCLEKLTD